MMLRQALKYRISQEIHLQDGNQLAVLLHFQFAEMNEKKYYIIKIQNQPQTDSN